MRILLAKVVFRAPNKSVDSRSIIKALEENGWSLVAVKGSHHQFKHPHTAGRVTVPHPIKDVKIGTLRSIERQSGIKLR